MGSRPDRPGEIRQALLTSGDYASEKDAWAAFDAIIGRHPDVFAVEREITGFYVQARYGVPPKQPRIDRILIPKAKLREAGWTLGPIGIECKHSGKKTGPAIAQAMDYSRAVFPLSDRFANCRVMLDWVFLWPVRKATGDIASIMDQHRIGCVWFDYGELRFNTGCMNAITIDRHGKVSGRDLPMGRKCGAR